MIRHARPANVAHTRRAFSLLELILAVALLSAILALATPSLDGLLGSLTWRELDASLHFAVAQASSTAKARHEAVALVWARSGETWNLYASPTGASEGSRTCLLRLDRRAQLQGGHGSADSSDSAQQWCVLWPNGQATQIASLGIKLGNQPQRLLRISTLSGTCTLAEDDADTPTTPRAPVLGAPISDATEGPDS